VIAFGSSISGAEAYRRYAEPGIRLAAEADSALYMYAAVGPVGRTYNLILEAAAQRADLEALVLVHPHTEITDAVFCEKARKALGDPRVGIVGCAGATEVRGMAWWEGDVVSAPLIQHYGEHGEGELPAFSWTSHRPPPAEVETVDGQLLVLAPAVVRELRFDESLFFTHGFDLDYCLQARAAGYKLAVADLRATYHRSVELVPNLDVWAQAHMQVAEKWDEALRGETVDELAWKRRARRAEADREAARAIAFSKSLKRDARVLELEQALEEKTASFSWRITAPLRALNQIRREAMNGSNSRVPA
jgi:Glycosyltransferase like family